MSWEKLYAAAKEKHGFREVSPFIEAGGVAAAVETDRGTIYTGVCLDTACSLGMCAERAAIANMVTNGESKVRRLLCVMGDGNLGLPCGACRELLMQLDKNSGDMEILLEREPVKTITLRELCPQWWGEKRFEQN